MVFVSWWFCALLEHEKAGNPDSAYVGSPMWLLCHTSLNKIGFVNVEAKCGNFVEVGIGVSANLFIGHLLPSSIVAKYISAT